MKTKNIYTCKHIFRERLEEMQKSNIEYSKGGQDSREKEHINTCRHRIRYRETGRDAKK